MESFQFGESVEVGGNVGSRVYLHVHIIIFDTKSAIFVRSVCCIPSYVILTCMLLTSMFVSIWNVTTGTYINDRKI